MKLLITYSSNTGNTKKLAEGIYKNLPFEDMDIMPMSDVKDMKKYDTVLVGYWVDQTGPNKEAKRFMEQISGKRVGIFATLGAYPDSQHAWDSIVNGENIVKDTNTVIGKFICQGKVDSRIVEMFKNSPNSKGHEMSPERLKKYSIAEKHPNEIDILAAADLFKDRI